jgi:hypothetical protein
VYPSPPPAVLTCRMYLSIHCQHCQQGIPFLVLNAGMPACPASGNKTVLLSTRLSDELTIKESESGVESKGRLCDVRNPVTSRLV